MSTSPTRLSRCCATACEQSPRLELCRWSHSLCQTLVGALYSCKPTISWISSSWRFFETLPKMSCCGVSVTNEISRPPAEKARGWEGVEVGAHQQPLQRIYFRNLFLCWLQTLANFWSADLYFSKKLAAGLKRHSWLLRYLSYLWSLSVLSTRGAGGTRTRTWERREFSPQTSTRTR